MNASGPKPVTRKGVAIFATTQHAQHEADGADLAQVVARVILLGVIPVRPDQLRDGEVGRVGDETAAVGESLAENAVVLIATRFGPVRPEVDVLAVDRDDGSTGSAVTTVGRVLVNEARHSGTLSSPTR